jgi:hypothetical protein
MDKAGRTAKRATEQAGMTTRQAVEEAEAIGKRAAEGAERVSAQVQAVAARQLEAATALNQPLAAAAVHVSWHYLQCANRLSAETMALAARRWRHDVEFAQSLARCGNWSDAVSLQQDWAIQAMNDYTEKVGNLARVAASVALGAWQPIWQSDDEPRS